MAAQPPPDPDPAGRALAADVQAIWERKAAFWDERMTEGDTFHRTLVHPATDRLLAVQPGETVLDIACGNGQVARRLAAQGARVTAFDFSSAFVELARARSADLQPPIEYLVLDATDREALLGLGRGRFDAAVCGMALMDMAEIDPLLAALVELLKPGGRFVFSVLHPCFNAPGAVLVMEEGEDAAGRLVTTYSVRMKRYLTAPPSKGAGMPNEPEPHWYFPRPLSALLGAAFRAGLVLDGLEEPAFPPGFTSQRPLSWVHFYDIPPVLVARLRPR